MAGLRAEQYKGQEGTCGWEARVSVTGAAVTAGNTSAVMDPSDMQSIKIAVVGGGLVSIHLDIFPLRGVTVTIITLNDDY